jgi:hypothetical protein
MSNFDEVRSTNEIFTLFEEQKETIIDMIDSNISELIDNLYTGDQLIKIDKSCRLNMGWGDVWSHYICPNCKILQRVVDIKSEDKSNMVLQVGKMKGQVITIKKEYNGKLILKIATEIKAGIDELYIVSPTIINYTIANDRKVNFYQLDRYTIDVLTSWLIERIMLGFRLPHYKTLYTTFICGEYNIRVNKHYPIKEYYLDLDMVYNWWRQLFVIFSTLENYGFLHGNTTIRKKFQPHDYIYKERRITGKITLFLDNFERSTITVGGNRLLPETKRATQIRRNMEIDYQTKNDNKSYISLNDKDSLMLSVTGLSIFPGTIGFYSHIVTLMLDPDFNNWVKRDFKLNTIWNAMWLPSQLKLLESKIDQFQGDPNNAVQLLLGMEMRGDIIEWLEKELW